MREGLLERWTALVPDLGPGHDLLERYAEPHRRYHDVTHLGEVLDAVDQLAAYADDPDTVRLAAWFHDAVYDPQRSDNEDASARLAAAMLPSAGVAASRVAEVARLVRLTASHRPAPDDANGLVLCDADLAILGSSPERYAAYVAAVRAEYHHVDEETFRRGRAAILEHLLSLVPLFRTPLTRERWEARARHNLRTELAALRS